MGAGPPAVTRWTNAVTARLPPLVLALACVAATAGAATAAASPVPVAGTLDLARADTTFNLPSEPLGVAFAGDLNGDGVDDVAITAPLATAEGRTRAGEVTVIFGVPGATADRLGSQPPGMIIEGPASGARAGASVAALGDVNGDGIGDLLVGAPRTSLSGRGRSAGAAYVVFGARDGGTVDLSAPGRRAAVVMGAGHGYHAGSAVAALGDVDGDGRREAVVGAPGATVDGRTGAGAVYVVLSSRLAGGADLARPADFGYEIDGASPASATGAAIAGARDMNGDGLPEVIVGARGLGATYMVWGRRDRAPVDLAALGDQGFAVLDGAGEGAGAAVADAGDVNGDGIPDLVIGAPDADANGRALSGSAYVVFGPGAPGPIALPPDPAAGFRIDGAASGDRLGAAVQSAGDVNGDRRADVLVGARGADPLARDRAGAAYVVFGGPLDLALAGTGAVRLAGSAAGARAGGSLAGGTDVAGDGRPDILVGAEHGPAALVLTPSPTPAPPASPRTACPTPVTNIEAIVGDSATMRRNDPGLLRRQAIQLLLSKPRPQRTMLGAVEFGTGAAEVFPPLALTGADFTAQLDVLDGLLTERLQGDAGLRSLAAGFAAAAAENPGRQAQILIVDGANDAGPEPTAAEVAVPTYIVGVGMQQGTPAAAQLDRLATQSGGRFFADVRADQLQAVLNDIDTDLGCETQIPVISAAAPAGSASAAPPAVTVAPGKTATFTTAPLRPPSTGRPRLRSVSAVVSWHSRGTRFAVRAIDVRRPGARPLRIPASVLRRALRRHRAVSFHQLLISARQGRTFIAVRLRGLRVSTPRVQARAASLLATRITIFVKRPRHGSGRGLRSQISGRWGPH
jgi:FG-GAP repeat